MSQFRARKPQSIGGEIGSKARASMVKASGDTTPCAPHQNQPKHNQSSRSKNKIPKSIRYDLDNALVGLCDVWFEDIKPHLVRNKIKLHVDPNGATASGDFSRLPPAAPGCSHLDPGAASDRLQQTSANFAAYCLTQRIASRAQFLRPPAPRSPLPPRPPSSSPPTPPDWTQNKNSKSKSPRRTRSPRKPRPLSPTTYRRVPRLCRTYSLQSPQGPRTRIRRIQTAAPVIHTREESCLLSLVPRRRTNTRNKYTQTDMPCTIKSLPRHISPLQRTNTEFTPCNMNPVPPRRQQHFINLMNIEGTVPSKYSIHRKQRRNLENKSNVGAKHVLRKKLSPGKRQNIEVSNVRCENAMYVDQVPTTTTRHSSPQKRVNNEPAILKTIPAPTPRYRSREKKPNKNSAPKHLQRNVDPSVAPPLSYPTEVKLPNSRNQSPITQPNGHQFWRCFATTNLNTTKNKRSQKNNRQPEIDPSSLFDKELINIIGAKNDKKLRVLYKSPSREEYPSVMNLMPSPRDREIETNISKKTLPWR